MNVEFNWWYSIENGRYETCLNLFRDGKHKAIYSYLPEGDNYTKEDLLNCIASLIKCLDRELATPEE